MNEVIAASAGLIIIRWAAQLGLEWMNQRHVSARAAKPPAGADWIAPDTYERSARYTMAKNRFRMVEATWESIVLAGALFSGVLPWFYRLFIGALGASAWAQAGWLLAVGFAFGITELPFAWHAQFHLEERFGFNTTTARLWWNDRIKGVVLAIILGEPLLTAIVALEGHFGRWWWVWAWACLMTFQIVMLVLGPRLILPWFNKLTPLPEGELREGLLQLGERAGFPARDIQVMDGSKRSRHSNAFFTGFGAGRRIVLFDTLTRHLGIEELEAVLAHEIGHYKRHHIVKSLAVSACGWLAGFCVLSVLLRATWFENAFGFSTGAPAPALLLCGLLAAPLMFWLSPLLHHFSRRHEYEADAYAAGLMRNNKALITALRKLYENNLGNLTPHPVYSGFYYSHPALLEREGALMRRRQAHTQT